LAHRWVAAVPPAGAAAADQAHSARSHAVVVLTNIWRLVLDNVGISGWVQRHVVPALRSDLAAQIEALKSDAARNNHAVKAMRMCVMNGSL
jgi:SH3-like domain-containing protein